MTKRRTKQKMPSKAAFAALGVAGLYVLGSAVGETEVPAAAATKPTVHLSATGTKCIEPARALKRHGFKDGNLVQAIASAAAESGCDNNAVNHNSDGSVDRCFMQINSVNKAKGLSTLDGCAKAAKKIQGKQGWSAWSSHTSGADRKFLPMARDVAAAIR